MTEKRHRGSLLVSVTLLTLLDWKHAQWVEKKPASKNLFSQHTSSVVKMTRLRRYTTQRNVSVLWNSTSTIFEYKYQVQLPSEAYKYKYRVQVFLFEYEYVFQVRVLILVLTVLVLCRALALNLVGQIQQESFPSIIFDLEKKDLACHRCEE